MAYLFAKHLTPYTHGYVVCDRCTTWRPRAACHEPTPEGFTLCRDEAWCKRNTVPLTPPSASVGRPTAAPTEDDEPHVWGR